MKWTKAKKWIVPLLVISFGVMNMVIYICEHNWEALLWLLCASFLLGCLFVCQKNYEQQVAMTDEYRQLVRDQEEHIQYLTNLDVMRKFRQVNTEARISAANCYRYIRRIGQLKVEIEQLKILNRNLLHNQGKGVRNYAKHTKRRDDQD